MGKHTNDKRSFYRIVYPHGENPSLETRGLDFTVIDISEGGCSFVIPPDRTFMLNETMKAILTFADRGQEAIRGKVVRVAGRKISIKFITNPGIPLSRIMAEQRYLIRKHKMSS